MPETSSADSPSHAPSRRSRLALRMADRIFPQEEERERFLDALEGPPGAAPAIIWTAARPENPPFDLIERQGWQEPFVDRLTAGQRAGVSGLHTAGRYYCLDFSSVFQASVLHGASCPVDGTVADVCAAPGGKSVYAAIKFGPHRLVCNEAIGKRCGPLVDNLRRCAVPRCAVFNVDPALLAAGMAQAAAVVLVDAPCSGQSLLVRGKAAPGCFHPSAVNMNSRRQRRIIAESSAIVAPGGFLAYSTCTYSPEENEKIVEWFLKTFPAFTAVRVEPLQAFQSHLTAAPCYRLWPQQGLGAGGFCALMQKSEGVLEQRKDLSLRPVWQSDDFPGEAA